MPVTGLPLDPELPIAIVGVGLIGGSIAKALRARGHRGTILGCGRDANRLSDAEARGLIDVSTTSIPEAARQARLMVFCTPVHFIAEQVREAAPHCTPGTLLTDAGSTKAAICEQLADLHSAPAPFIGSHPIAGKERQGFEFADADLYAGRLCVVTPTAETGPTPLGELIGFWEFLGMRVETLSPEAHDETLAKTSHLPHLLAAVVAACVTPEQLPFAGTGFRDTTRIASGDPELWTAIVSENAPHLLSALEECSGRLNKLIEAVRREDAEAIREHLSEGKRLRDRLE